MTAKTVSSAWALALFASLAFAQGADLLKKQFLAQNRTNAYRRGAGLPELNLNEMLSRAAQGHAEYIEKTGHYGHTQDKSRPGFTGEDPSVRATAAGYKWMVIMEDVAGDADPTRAVDSLIASVYHRLPFVNGEVRDLGLGFSSKATVIMFAATQRTTMRETDPVICPGDNTTAVPPAWTALEFPNPLPPELKPPLGCPVSISFPGAQKIDLVSASLENAAGTNVDGILLTPQTDPHKLLKQDVFLIPRKPLEERNTYKATFAVMVDGTMKAKTWFFVTGSRS